MDSFEKSFLMDVSYWAIEYFPQFQISLPRNRSGHPFKIESEVSYWIAQVRIMVLEYIPTFTPNMVQLCG